MENIILLAFLKYGSPWALLIPIVVMLVRQGRIMKDIRDMKNGMVWKDVCEATHEPINEDLKRIKDKVFDGD